MLVLVFVLALVLLLVSYHITVGVCVKYVKTDRGAGVSGGGIGSV